MNISLSRQQDRQAFLPLFALFSGPPVVLVAVLAAQFGKTAGTPPILQEPCFGRPLGRVVQGRREDRGLDGDGVVIRPPTGRGLEEGG
jgi:hypothetical protein